MKVEMTNYSCTVTREDWDKRMRPPGWPGETSHGHAPDELSTVLHHVKLILNARGYDLIKKRMAADGHLFGFHTQQYLRVSGPRSQSPHVYIYFERYAVADGLEEYNKTGQLRLKVALDVYEKQPDCVAMIDHLEGTIAAPADQDIRRS